MENKRLVFTVGEELHQKIMKAAKDLGISGADFIRMTMKEKLSEHESISRTKKFSYIRGILKNRFGTIDDLYVIDMLEKFEKLNYPMEQMIIDAQQSKDYISYIDSCIRYLKYKGVII